MTTTVLTPAPTRTDPKVPDNVWDVVTGGLEVAAFIPARGGSKGLPRKNVLELGGKPLIAYSIETALNCPAINRVIVSTEDPEIAEVALEWGAEVPFIRPVELSHDRASLNNVLDHCRETLRLEHGYFIDVVCCILPTSPFRSQDMVNHLARLAQAGYNVSTVKRVTKTRYYQRGAHGLRRLVTQPEASSYHYPVGVFQSSNYLIAGGGQRWVYEVTDPASLVDIDTEEDFKLAQALVESGYINNVRS